MMRSAALLVYYLLGRWIPAYPRWLNAVGKRLRAMLCRAIFDTVGSNVNIRPAVTFGRGQGVTLLDNSGLGDRTRLVTMAPIWIGRNVMVGPECLFLTGNHGYEDPSRTLIEQDVDRRPIVIEDDVWLSARVTVCPGAVVRSRTVVAAGSVVVGEIGPGGVYGGTPARRIRDIPN